MSHFIVANLCTHILLLRVLYVLFDKKFEKRPLTSAKLPVASHCDTGDWQQKIAASSNVFSNIPSRLLLASF